MGLQRLLPRALQLGPLIPKHVVASLGQSHPRTPDYYDLAHRRELHVFVADEMMHGHRAQMPEEFARRYSGAYSVDGFLMFQKKLGKYTFPVVMRKDPQFTCGAMQRAAVAPLRGELWIIKPEFIVALDNYRENGQTFHRHLIDVSIPYREKFEREFATIREGGELRIKSMHTGRPVYQNGDAQVGVEHVFGEWQEPKIVPAYTYIADPEKWLWEAHSDPEFKAMRLVRPNDRNTRPYYHFNAVNGQAPSQPHQPNNPPHIEIRSDPRPMKERLVKKFLTHPWFMEQQRQRNEEEAQFELALKNGGKP